ncbi:MAG: acyl-CoA dehydratase activase [Dehalococcoidia bacterium]|nr:acyl-CoA dehydratase activase [Dehalococcoidia bacterium]
MISAGIDAGFRNVKVVLVSGSDLLCHVVLPAGKESAGTVAVRALLEALQQAGLQTKDVGRLAATGAGKAYVPFAQEQLPEAVCLARGIDMLQPLAETVLDMGAYKALAVRCQKGMALRTSSNDKCAGGAGAYLEMVAKLLGMESEATAALSMESRKHLEIMSTCAIFAESEIISLIHAGERPEDILKGVFKGVAQRVYPLLTEIGLDRNMAMVGGIARNGGVVRAIEEMVGHPVAVPSNPDIVGALGAALMAKKDRGALPV